MSRSAWRRPAGAAWSMLSPPASWRCWRDLDALTLPSCDVPAGAWSTRREHGRGRGRWGRGGERSDTPAGAHARQPAREPGQLDRTVPPRPGCRAGRRRLSQRPKSRPDRARALAAADERVACDWRPWYGNGRWRRPTTIKHSLIEVHCRRTSRPGRRRTVGLPAPSTRTPRRRLPSANCRECGSLFGAPTLVDLPSDREVAPPMLTRVSRVAPGTMAGGSVVIDGRPHLVLNLLPPARPGAAAARVTAYPPCRLCEATLRWDLPRDGWQCPECRDAPARAALAAWARGAPARRCARRQGAPRSRI